MTQGKRGLNLTLTKSEQRKLEREAGVRRRVERSRQPGRRGWKGRGGGAAVIDLAPEYRGTTRQVCGLFPFATVASTPMVGVPLGKNLLSGQTMCCDPISWFLSRLIDTPSAFVLGRPGKGKSSLARRLFIGMVQLGIVPIALADSKPDYRDVTEAVGGDVIRFGRGRGSINPLDPGPVRALLDQMSEGARTDALADLRARRLEILIALLELVRHTAVSARERNILTVSLRMLDETVTDRDPLVGDLLELVRSKPQPLRTAALDRGDDVKYLEQTEGLEEGLMALGEDGPFGTLFCRPTTVPIRLGVPTTFDVSEIPDDDQLLQAAAQAVCWSYGSSAVSAARRAADDGLMDQMIYMLFEDEIWKGLRVWERLVYLMDATTRMNRQMGIGQIMITHTMEDLSLSRDDLTKIANGFVERSALVFLGGLSAREMGNLREVFDMSAAEVDMIQSWSAQASLDPRTGHAVAPPGQGNFLLKIGKAPGSPFHVELTDSELAVNDTNKRWAELAFAGSRAQ